MKKKKKNSRHGNAKKTISKHVQNFTRLDKNVS